ncbi:hypothetical protein U9M48_005496 [Paspalum notatum var. saurae]|uniref:HIT domain-containing protein n=1 Tax=Paspalum notatum var. saurae TaxID=547442 RepID=A0AAQ3PXR0_PASNO
MVNLRPLLRRSTRAVSSAPRPPFWTWSYPLIPAKLVLYFLGREVKRFAELSSDETSDLWDGPQAGQTVPHVHIHVIPRKKGDFEKNDEIYDAIDVKEKELKEKLDLDIDRKDRSMDEMAHEANEYRALFS